jgi:hypothetical protein
MLYAANYCFDLHGVRGNQFLKNREEKGIELINENVEEFQGIRLRQLLQSSLSKIIVNFEISSKIASIIAFAKIFKQKLHSLHTDREWLVESDGKIKRALDMDLIFIFCDSLYNIIKETSYFPCDFSFCSSTQPYSFGLLSQLFWAPSFELNAKPAKFGLI